MTFKKAVILGGALLLAAGCSNSVTGPSAASVDVTPSAVRGGKKTTQPTLPRFYPASAAASDSTCHNFPVTSGFVDSTCVIE
jgi:hypothetical protein